MSALSDPGSARSLTPAQIRQIPPAQLAYLGDAVYELYVRSRYVFPPRRIQTYHRQVVAQVRAEQQAQHLQTWLPELTETEQAIVRQGRNATGSRPKRVDVATYQQATSFETLIGFLHLADPPRLQWLLAQLELDPTAS